MNPIVFALRHPYTVLVGVVSLALAAGLALWRMPIDIFPDLNTPVIYVAQPYGGLSPQQMEGHLTNYFEYHFLYISGIHHVESKNIQGLALMKLVFHPGTNMAQAMAETVAHVNRSRSFMPPNTVPPFVMRYDAGSVPVGYLVFSSQTKSIGELQDIALFRVRPMFSALPGVSAPPPFGGNQRTIILRANPERLRAHGMSPDEIVNALNKGNRITPAGAIVLGDQAPMVPVNSVVEDYKELEKLPIRQGPAGPVYVRDVAKVIDGQDVTTGYGLVNGRRSVYILVTKRADASTLDVVREVKRNIPKMQAVLPDDIQVSYAFDQSPFVTRAMAGVGAEAALGAVLTGLMVLLFLRDWRSVLVVVLNIPLALLGAVFAMYLTGLTLNLMTLGGLALAVGILVDEATVEVENIHTQMGHTPSVARAVRLGNQQTAVPRLLAMLCVLAVFIPSFFMRGAARALFLPLALAVGFSMVTSYLLSSTFVPVLSVWLLKHVPHGPERVSWLQRLYNGSLGVTLRLRWVLLLAYGGAVAAGVMWWLGGHAGLGTDLFPQVDTGQFQMRVKAPDGTPLEATEALAQDILKEVARQAGGEENVDTSVSLVGTASYNYPINSIFLWTSGPQEAVLRVALKRDAGVRIDELKARLRDQLPRLERARGPAMRDVKLSFEAGDIVSQVMSFGSPTPIEVVVHGSNMADNLAHARKVRAELEKIDALRDLAFGQSLAYPSLDVVVDRERAGFAGVTAEDVGTALAPVTLSSRFVTPNYWRDPKNGIGYQVQVEVEAPPVGSVSQLEQLPVKQGAGGAVRVQDVARVQPGTRPGQVDRYDMRRLISLTASVAGEDLGRVSQQVLAAVRAAPANDFRGTSSMSGGRGRADAADVRGLGLGPLLAVAVILLLTAYYSAWACAWRSWSSRRRRRCWPASPRALVLYWTTPNVQSFMGAIMATRAVANAILLVTFAENACRGPGPVRGKAEGLRHRLRPILMTSFAMMAGMPMRAGAGRGRRRCAPLGRAVIGGLGVATFATLFLLPSIFLVVQGGASTASASLDPDDPESELYDPAGANLEAWS
ncbi:MAG: efflux RND transporter permease subunit [Gemmataceae bacterium]